MKCEFCEHEMTWGHDEDYGDEDVMSVWSCPNCHCIIGVIVLEEGDK